MPCNHLKVCRIIEIFLSKGNTTFINDSNATSFSASKYALSSLKNIYWIIGGLPKKGDKINFKPFKNNIIKSYIIGKHINFFKKQIEGKLPFSITKNLEKSIIQILKDSKLKKNSKKFVLLSLLQLLLINLKILREEVRI